MRAESQIASRCGVSLRFAELNFELTYNLARKTLAKLKSKTIFG